MTGRGLRLERTAVGDRYVVEAMRRGGWTLGGEQSGHIGIHDYAPTGDGWMAGLHVLADTAGYGVAATRPHQQFEDKAQKLKIARNMRNAWGALASGYARGRGYYG